MKDPNTLESGITLVELLMVVVLMGIATSLTLPNILAVRERHELNSATKVAVGWLDDLRRRAIQESDTCEATWKSITDFEGVSSYVIEGKCLNNQDNVLNLDINATTTKTIEHDGHDGIVENDIDIKWVFTPRGTTTTSGQVIFTFKDKDSVPGRCIKLTSPLALIRAGRQTQTNSSQCDFTNSF